MSQRLSLRAFAKCHRGTAAVEFAVILPILLVLFCGGFALTQAILISRKVTITTRALADLTSQYVTMSASDMANVLNASSQIVAPFSSSPLSIRLSEITTDALGLTAKVTWSAGLNQTPFPTNTPYVLPAGMNIPNASYILSQVSYSYTPPSMYGSIGPFSLSDSLFMVPRLSTSVTYTGS
jgi:Flp pilus assembly protein TadG